MDRRKSIKALVLGTVSTGVLIEACDAPDTKAPQTDKAIPPASNTADRMPEEVAANKALNDEKFFTDHEMATIAILCDIIIPKDEKSGSATDAKVPDFIEFMAKDKPEFQTPLRGGISWLDQQSLKKFEKSFADISAEQRIGIVDQIAYPQVANKVNAAGVKFFTLMRNLTVTGFYTTEMGYKDLGYVGNRPNQWNGVPADVLAKYNMAYSERELKECINFDKA